MRLLMVVALMGLAGCAWSNMGTAVVIAAAMHFVLCNPLVALLEAALLTRWAQLNFARALTITLSANYLSYFAGLLLGNRISLTLGGIDRSLQGSEIAFLQSLPYLLMLFAVLLFALTAFIEALPLYLGGKRDWHWAIGNSAKVNLVSYALLTLFYLSFSDFGFLGNRFQPDLRFVQTAPATVYYIAPDGNLMAIPITGGTPRLLHKQVIEDTRPLRSAYAPGGLYLKREKKSLRWWLTFRNQRLLPLAIDSQRVRNQKADDEIRAPDWREGDAHWRIIGWAEKPTVRYDEQKRYPVGLAFPFQFDPHQSMGMFPLRGLSYLPGDYAVFELGGRIWVLHLPTRRIGLLATGYMPIAIIETQSSG